MKPMTTEDIQAVSLDVLKNVHTFCVKNKIKYSLQAGTLIGAIRHKGFIPWDDDIDIVMPRPDYNKFIKIFNTSSTGSYQLFSREIPEGGDVNIAFARVCEMEKTFVDDSNFPWCKRKKGVWIDIFPLDSVEDSYKEFKKRNRYITFLYKIFVFKRWSHYKRDLSTLNKKNKYILKKIIAFFISDKLLDKQIQYIQELDWDSTNYYSQLSNITYGEKERCPKSLIAEIKLHPFEDGEFYIMKGYDEYLRQVYGDYMKLPPEEKRVCTHHFNDFYWKD